MNDYKKLKQELKTIKMKSQRKFASMMLEVYEETGESIEEAVIQLMKIKAQDKQMIEEYKNSLQDIYNIEFIDDEIISDYKEEMENKGYHLYSNYGIESFDILENEAKYLRGNNIDFIIGEAYDSLGRKIEDSFSLYIKNYSNNNQVQKIIDSIPSPQITSTEEYIKRCNTNREKYKDVKSVADLDI